MPATLWILVILLPLVSAPLVYLLGRTARPYSLPKNYRSPAGWLSLAALLAAGACLALAWTGAPGQSAYRVGGELLRFDGVSLLLAVSVLVLSSAAALFSMAYLQGEDNQEKFFALLNMLAGTMIGLGCATDLFNLWVWFEAMAVSSYMLVTFYRHNRLALEAGVKYLIQSAAGSGLVLTGIALVFAQTGTLSLAEIHAQVNASQQLAGGPQLAGGSLLLAAGALFIAGFGVKTALVPLHTWLPDAHSQAPSGVSALLSGVVIETGLVALLRVSAALTSSAGSAGSAPAVSAWGPILLGFGAVNMLVGNLMALRQVQVKRLLAYSSLSHIGYMLVGFGAALTFQTVNGAQGGFFHLLTHALMKGLAFLSAGSLLFSLHTANGDHTPLLLSDLAGAARRYPLAAFTFSLAVLGLGGLPPLAGFMSKWQIFLAGFQTGSGWVMALVVFAALNSTLSLAYYAPIVNLLYRREPGLAVKQGKPLPFTMALPLLLLAAAVLLLGVWPALANGLVLPAGLDWIATFTG
jgi:proton-translocating NADH-quinone oxidoreductase chain N